MRYIECNILFSKIVLINRGSEQQAIRNRRRVYDEQKEKVVLYRH